MCVGIPSTAEELLHKEASLSAADPLCGPVHHPGKINCSQLDKTIGSHRCWHNATCTWRDFLSAGACSPVGKDGSASRGNQEGKSEFSVLNHNNHKAVHEGKQALLNWATLGTQNGNKAMPVMMFLSPGPNVQDYISLRYRHHLEHVKWKPTGEILLLLLLSHFSRVRLCATPTLGFSRQEHWSGLPFPSPMHKSEK